MDINQILILALIGLIGGLASGLLGIGGGIIMIPAMVLFMGFSQHQAQGTTLAVLVFPVALLAVINYYKSGYIDFKFVFVLIFTFVIGSYFGSRWAVNIDEKLLKKIFGAFLFLVSIRLILGK
jgi:uncharacterized membrane protein YfcA